MSAKSFSSLPDAIKKRDILHAGKTDSEQLKKLAQDFESAGGVSDAIDFYAMAKDTDSLKNLRARAAEEGNTFLILKISKFLTDDKVGLESDLLTAAKKAEELGKIRYAIKAYERLEQNEKAESLRQTIANDGDIRAELESRVFIPQHNEEE